MKIDKFASAITIIGLLVAFVGIVYVDSYYTAFTISYEYNQIPITHFIYRSIEVFAVFDFYSSGYIYRIFILIIYVSLFAWALTDFNSPEKESGNENSKRNLKRKRLFFLIDIFILGVAIISSYYLARNLGKTVAESDMLCNSTTLPMLQEYTTEKGNKELYLKDYRLLLTSGEYIWFFHTIKNIDNPPTIIREKVTMYKSTRIRKGCSN
jgi:hypothetical protein